MMQYEFEQIAGYEVSTEDYNNIIEPMYMATNLTKTEFVKVIDKKRFALPTKAKMLKDMRQIANSIFEICGQRSFHEEKEQLDKLAKAYAKRFYGLDWSNDLDAYVYCISKYAYYGVRQDRGCTFPETLVIGRGNHEYERITLVK